MKKHWRPLRPIPPGFVGRTACGRMAPSEATTLVRSRVTCQLCKRTVAWEQAVQGQRPDARFYPWLDP